MHARYAIVSRWSAAMVHWGLDWYRRQERIDPSEWQVQQHAHVGDRSPVPLNTRKRDLQVRVIHPGHVAFQAGNSPEGDGAASGTVELGP